MFKKLLFLVFSGLLLGTNLIAQNDKVKLEWVKEILIDQTELLPQFIKTDLNGNVYTSGHYSGSTDFDPGVGEYYLPSHGVYVRKLNAAGEFLWAISVVVNHSSFQNSVMGVDNDGNVYLTGILPEAGDFNPDSLVSYNLMPVGTSMHDMYILKLDSNGNFLWASSIDYVTAASIVFDDNGNS